MKQAVLYARVSSKEQEREGFSVPAQLKLLQEYAQKHGFEIAAEFTDAETAKKAGRTNFKAMVDTINKRKDITAILVEKTDRLTRNFHDYVMIDDLINKRDIEVHLVKEGEILSQRAKSHTKLIHGIKVVLAKNFIDNLSEETAKGMLEKAQQGHWPSTAPYGYRNNKETRLVELDEQKAAYVKRAFELYATGCYSLKGLVHALYDEGLRFRPSAAKPSLSNIHHILTNVFYTGKFVFRGMQMIGHHPPIVTTALFLEVQTRLKQKDKPAYTKREVAYKSLITCGHCGCTVTGDIKQKGHYVYYRCTHFKGKCPDPYIREERLQEQFAEMVRSFSVDDEQYAWMVSGLKQINATREQEVEERGEQITYELNRLNQRISRLYEDKLDGEIDEAFYRRKAQEYKLQQQDLEASLHRLRSASEDQMEMGLSILEFAKNAYPLFIQMEAVKQATLLRIVLSKCELIDGKLYPVYKKPFDVLAQKGKNNEKYPQGNSNPCRLREREVS